MPTSLPLEIRLLVLGLVATVALVGGAAALRASAPGRSATAEAAPPGGAASGRVALAGSAAAAPPASGAPRAARPSAEARLPGEASRAARAQLAKEMQLAHFAQATDALAHVVETDPKAAEDGEVRGQVVELAMRVTLLTGNEPDRVFDMIAGKMGTAGVDILYELLTTRGGSRAASRAEALLKDAAVRARGTAAMRIAYDLRATGGCEEKKALFPRAKAEGDGRTLGQLQMLNQRCGRRSSACCLQNDPGLKDAMEGIKARGG